MVNKIFWYQIKTIAVQYYINISKLFGGVNIGKENEIVKFTVAFEFTEGEDANAVISDIVSFHDGQNIHEKVEKAESVAKDLGEGLKNKIIEDEFICMDATFFRSNLIKAFTLKPDYDSLK